MADRRPLIAVLVLAPVLGECLTGASSPLELLVYPPGVVLLVCLYGCGALLCREIARRHGLGLRGLCLLAAAYAVFEEALVDRFWFHARPADEGGLGHYSEVWHTNLLLATNLTVFHVAVSIVSTIVLVELLFPTRRREAWVGRRGLAVAAVAFVVVPPLLYGEYTLDPLPQLVVAAALMAGLVLAAIRLPGRPSLWESRAATGPARRGVAPIAFAGAAAGRYDLALGAIGVVVLLWLLGRRSPLSPTSRARPHGRG